MRVREKESKVEELFYQDTPVNYTTTGKFKMYLTKNKLPISRAVFFQRFR